MSLAQRLLLFCFSLRWRLGSVYLSLPLVFSFYSPWKWSRLSTTSDTAGKRTLSLILSAQKLMKQLEIFVISTQNFKCCFLAWAVEYSWADPGNTHHNTVCKQMPDAYYSSTYGWAPQDMFPHVWWHTPGCLCVARHTPPKYRLSCAADVLLSF